MSNKIDDFTVLPSDSNSVYKTYIEFVNRKKSLNSKEMESRGWVNQSNAANLASVFKEFLTAQNKASTLYRKTAGSDCVAPLAWVSRVKQMASLYAGLSSPPDFEGLSKADLKRIAKMSARLGSIKDVQSALYEQGVIVIYEQSLAGMKVDGACFKLPSGIPVVALSLRYSRVDSFWFTLLHELAHVFLHYDQLDDVIVDDFDEADSSLIEKQANKLALESFVPRSAWRNCEPKFSREPGDVITFAKKMGIHPAIVAGRLHHELGRYDLFSDIVNETDVRGILFHD